MKKYLLFVFAASLSVGLFAAEVSGVKDEAKATEFKKLADSDDSKSKEADTKGDKALAAAYKKCADAKRKMADAYLSGNSDALKKANIDSINAQTELDKTQKGIKDKPAAPPKTDKKKLTK